MIHWKKLSEPEIRSFIRKNEGRDVAELALEKPPGKDWPMKLVLDQVKARQKARLKMPGWHETPDVIFPPADTIEQASSQATALYKASLAEGKLLVDLTAGAGIDFAAMLQNFESGIAVEQDRETAEILDHNLELLTKKSFAVRCADAQDFARDMPACDLVYLDPQRRSDKKKGLYKFQDGSPDVIKLLPGILQKTKTILLKTSPVLDIDLAINALGFVHAVHVVEWRGECREVLYLLHPEAAKEPAINAVVIDDEGKALKKITFTRAEESASEPAISAPQKYLFEPSAAFQKAGCFKFLAHRYGVKKLHAHTHLYTSDKLCPDFPGRGFEITGIYPGSGKTLPLAKANLSVRNFPSDVAALRRKLKLKDGGEDYIFACTLEDERKVLIQGRKLRG